jgi:hypothetical protein
MEHPLCFMRHIDVDWILCQNFKVYVIKKRKNENILACGFRGVVLLICVEMNLVELLQFGEVQRPLFIA